MIGPDTNVQVRPLVQNDLSQSRKVTQLISKQCTRDDLGFINRVVLCELVWVSNRRMRVDRYLRSTCEQA